MAKHKHDLKIHFGTTTFKHFATVCIDRELTDSEKTELGTILSAFPDHSGKWFERFKNFDSTNYNKELLKVAANAFDMNGITMLGQAATLGRDDGIFACEKLIAMGAALDTVDRDINKLALHWAICNGESFHDRESVDAARVVQVLLDHGARTDIKSYQNTTVLQYAQSRGYTAAAKIIIDAETKRAVLAKESQGLQNLISL